ncbi:MAG: hypothetical protein KAX55_09800 [Propionivibrio sp.]|nr:hypothetical protein [Propionivibrio sp.]
MKMCFRLPPNGQLICIPILVRKRWPWEKVIIKDIGKEVMGEPRPIPWITGDFKAEVARDLQVLADIEELAHQLEVPAVKDAVMQGLKTSISKMDVPKELEVSLDGPTAVTHAAA